MEIARARTRDEGAGLARRASRAAKGHDFAAVVGNGPAPFDTVTGRYIFEFQSEASLIRAFY